jgi:hypothetical protein
MLQITLAEEERLTLKELLQCCLAELRVEIHHTDDMDFKEMLKNRKNVLVKILNELTMDNEHVEQNCK